MDVNGKRLLVRGGEWLGPRQRIAIRSLSSSQAWHDAEAWSKSRGWLQGSGVRGRLLWTESGTVCRLSKDRPLGGGRYVAICVSTWCARMLVFVVILVAALPYVMVSGGRIFPMRIGAVGKWQKTTLAIVAVIAVLIGIALSTRGVVAAPAGR